MIICIPSKGRPTGVKTLDLLEGYNKKKIFIFVEPQDYENYKRCIGNKATVVNIQKNNMGLPFVSNIITHPKQNIDYLWKIDDDMIYLHERYKYNKEKDYWHLNCIKNPKKILNILEICYNDFKNNYSNSIQYGIPFRGVNVFYEGQYKENERICAFSLYNIRLIKELNLIFDDNCLIFEDYDFIAQYLMKGQKNICNYKYGFSCVPFTKNTGGLDNIYENKNKSKKICDYLFKKYGNYVNIKYKEKINFYQIYFKWKKIKNEKQHK